MNSKNKTGLLIISLILLGGVLRFAALGSVPAGMHQDEAFVAWNAFAIFHEGMDSAGHHFPVYMADWGDGHSALYVWLLLPILALSGGKITPFLSRLPQAAVSLLTLWAVYCLMKRLFNARAALWSLFLLAICPWHIMMSRWGLDANLAPGFLMFGLTFFLKGVEIHPGQTAQKKFLLLSAFFYGCSLYCYAVIWPVVPFLLAFQILYCLFHQKLCLDKWSLLSALLLFLMALPLLLFVLINSEILPEIALPFLTIPKMNGYRGSEIAVSLPEMWRNLRTALSLLYHQNLGSPYDILLPWGLFYDLGRIFILIGAISLLKRLTCGLWHKAFTGEFFLFVQLAGGGLCCLLVTAVLHQINALYIPLVLSEAYGVWTVTEFLRRQKNKWWERATTWGLTTVYLLCLLLFQKDYYTDYRSLVGAYFADGLRECVDFAWEQCQENDIHTITVEKGAQWPRLLLYTETLPSEYLASVVYDVPPAPASFKTKGIRINTRIHYDTINQESIYILYYTDLPVFEENFALTNFQDWYVAVPVHP